MIFDRIMSVLWYLNFFLRKKFVDLGWIKLFKKKKLVEVVHACNTSAQQSEM